MERVAFLIEPTGQRIGCLLNPEDLVVRRRAGLTSRQRGGGFLSAALPGGGGHDDTLLLTGGGRTEFDLDLLFDVDLADPDTRSNDVRDMTEPIWALCENSPQANGTRGPTAARFIWGKAWNVPVIVVSASERLQRFTTAGVPQRAWLRLLLRRVDSPEPHGAMQPPAVDLTPAEAGLETGGAVSTVPAGQDGLGRLDLLAAALFGDPSLWREIAAFNDIDDPLAIDAGRPLRVPPSRGAP